MAASAPQLEPTTLEYRIASVVRQMLLEQGKDAAAARVTPTASFERELGLGSLDLVELMVRCESKLDVEVPDEVAEQADTPAGWAKAILLGGQDQSASSAYRIVPPSNQLPPEPREASTLADVLRSHAEADPGRIHVHVIHGGKGEARTYSQILEAAEIAARGLVSQGVKRGDRVGILLPNSSEFFDAFLAVILAGATPAPLYPPADLTRIEDYVDVQAGILRQAEARGLIIFEEVRPLAQLLRAKVPGMIGAATLERIKDFGCRSGLRLPEPAETALIQTTSGSTGDPKPVELSHANILHNVRAIGRRLRVRGGDAVVSWMPLASDLGLVGCWLFSLYHGTPLTQLSPLEFLERPESWFWAIHDSRGTLSAAPNFAFELCARRIPLWTLEGVDLSSWRAAVNAGELVRPETVERFTKRFERFGFRPNAMLPAYGLAEATVALTVPEPGRVPLIDDQGFYSVGAPLDGYQVRTIDGRLLFRGPFSSDWVETGDLAVIRDEEVYVTSRAGDVISRLNGRLAPEVIETAAAGVCGVHGGAVAAFCVADLTGGTARLVVVAESAAEEAEELDRVRAAIAAAVTHAAGEAPDDVQVIPLRSLPKTANGKLRRTRARDLYQAGALGDAGCAPWIGIASLWRKNFGPLTTMSMKRVARRAGALFREQRAALAAATGTLDRDRAKAILDVLRHGASLEGRVAPGVLVVAHRCGPLDPLVVLAVSPRPVRFAGDAVLIGTPEWLQPALQPLIASDEEQTREALKTGIVVQFPDSGLGRPPGRSRFRLWPLRAAEHIAPAALREIGDQTVFRIGAETPKHESPVESREKVRQAIARIYA